MLGLDTGISLVFPHNRLILMTQMMFASFFLTQAGRVDIAHGDLSMMDQ